MFLFFHWCLSLSDSRLQWECRQLWSSVYQHWGWWKPWRPSQHVRSFISSISIMTNLVIIKLFNASDVLYRSSFRIKLDFTYPLNLLNLFHIKWLHALLVLQVSKSKARYIPFQGGKLWAWRTQRGECNPCTLDVAQKWWWWGRC